MVIRTLHEVCEVFLRDPDVLEELPRRVREVVRTPAAKVGRETGDRGVERGVGVFPASDRATISRTGVIGSVTKITS